MTTPVPTPGNGAQNGFAKALLPAIGIIGAVVLALGGIYAYLHRGAGSSPNPGGVSVVAEMKVGTVLPDFNLYAFKGDTVAASSLKSKVSLINFWATWCEACMVEMPSIIKLYKDYRDRGFNVLAVDLDTNPETVLPRTIQKYGMPFTVYTDRDSQLADFFQIQAIPLSVVIDSNRKILMIQNEGLDWNGDEFKAELEKWLAG